MSLRRFVCVLLCLPLTLVAGQVGPFGLSAEPSSAYGNLDASRHNRNPKMVPLPKPSPMPSPPKADGAQAHSSVWRDARHKGAALSAALRRTHAQTAPSRGLDKQLHLGSYHLSRPHPHWMLWTPFPEIPKVGPYVRVAVHARPSPLNIVNQAPYVNTYDPARGIIGLEWDYKAFDRTPPAQQLHLSDLVYASYRQAGTERAPAAGGPAAPRYVVATWVATLETKMVLHEAHGRDIFRQHTWRPGSPEFEAMLGTTQGKVVMHLLRDFCKWSHCRVPSAVKTQFTQVPDAPPGWFMLFELRGRDAKGKNTMSIDEE